MGVRVRQRRGPNYYSGIHVYAVHQYYVFAACFSLFAAGTVHKDVGRTRYGGSNEGNKQLVMWGSRLQELG